MFSTAVSWARLYARAPPGRIWTALFHGFASEQLAIRREDFPLSREVGPPLSHLRSSLPRVPHESGNPGTTSSLALAGGRRVCRASPGFHSASGGLSPGSRLTSFDLVPRTKSHLRRHSSPRLPGERGPEGRLSRMHRDASCGHPGADALLLAPANCVYSPLCRMNRATQRHVKDGANNRSGRDVRGIREYLDAGC